MADPTALEKIRSRILTLAASTEPARDALVKSLVEFEGYRYADAVETLDGMIATGTVKNVGGAIVSATPQAASVPAVMPAPPQARPEPQSTVGPLVKVKLLEPGARLPQYADDGSAAADVFALTDAKIAAHSWFMVRTGFAMELPKGYRAMIHSRSGLSVRFGIEKGAGVLDNSYRGEVAIVLFNHGEEDYHVSVGDRIAQMTIEKFEQATFKQVETLSETARSSGGFGSTGR